MQQYSLNLFCEFSGLSATDRCKPAFCTAFISIFDREQDFLNDFEIVIVVLLSLSYEDLFNLCVSLSWFASFRPYATLRTPSFVSVRKIQMLAFGGLGTPHR